LPISCKFNPDFGFNPDYLTRIKIQINPDEIWIIFLCNPDDGFHLDRSTTCIIALQRIYEIKQKLCCVLEIKLVITIYNMWICYKKYVHMNLADRLWVFHKSAASNLSNRLTRNMIYRKAKFKIRLWIFSAVRMFPRKSLEVLSLITRISLLKLSLWKRMSGNCQWKCPGISEFIQKMFIFWLENWSNMLSRFFFNDLNVWNLYDFLFFSIFNAKNVWKLYG
jgi:hypothetical protein